MTNIGHELEQNKSVAGCLVRFEHYTSQPPHLIDQELSKNK